MPAASNSNIGQSDGRAEFVELDDGVVVFLGRNVTSDRIQLELWKTDTGGASPVRIATGVATAAISRDGGLLVGLTVGSHELVVLDL